MIDASHRFAAAILRRAAGVCAGPGALRVRMLRPARRPGPGDRRICVGSPARVAALVPAGATVFVATGRDARERLAGPSTQQGIVRRAGAAPSRLRRLP